MIRFAVDYREGTQYGAYQKQGVAFDVSSHRIYLTSAFIGISSIRTTALLGLYIEGTNPRKKSFTTVEVEEHINMAVFRVLYKFLGEEGEYGL